MNKKNNRKGFTIVELVIVIAVIAVLATVLVPTFGNVIEKANASALLQEVKNEYTNYVTKYAADENFTDTLYIQIGDAYYQITDGNVELDENEDYAVPAEPTTDPTPSATTIVYCAECGHIYANAAAENETPSYECECDAEG